MGHLVYSITNFFKRILHSLVPPFMGQNYNKIYVDVFGPSSAVIILIVLLNYGHTVKDTNAALKRNPTEILSVMSLYVFIMPIITSILNYFAKSVMQFKELLCVLGYSLYGHIVTILVSYILSDGQSNAVFFICMIIFAGCSTLRVALLILNSIALPVARLLVCSFVSMVQLLFLVFIYFRYIHPTFVYGHAHIDK